MEISSLETNVKTPVAANKAAIYTAVSQERTSKADPAPQKQKFVETEVAEALSTENVEKALETTNAALQSANNSLRFQMDKSLKHPIVSVVDENSGEVLRQFPSEEMVRVSRNIDSLRGVIFDQRS